MAGRLASSGQASRRGLHFCPPPKVRENRLVSESASFCRANGAGLSRRRRSGQALLWDSDCALASGAVRSAKWFQRMLAVGLLVPIHNCSYRNCVWLVFGTALPVRSFLPDVRCGPMLAGVTLTIVHTCSCVDIVSARCIQVGWQERRLPRKVELFCEMWKRLFNKT